MKILKTQTLRGPNYWSIRRSKLILLRLDLEALAESPSNEIEGFYEGLVEALPSLVEHHCSPGCRGGFLSRVEEGTMMGHILEHVALELQTLAGMPVGFGRTRETSDPGIYQVVFEYQNEQAGRYAARAAFRLCNSIITNGHYSQAELHKDLEDLRTLRADASLGPSSEALVREAEARGIPWTALETRNLIQFGQGKYQKRTQASLTSHSDVLSVELACDKESTKQILANAGIPVPKGAVVYYLSELEDAIADIGGYPLVIKPLDGNHGRGITLDIQSWQEAEAAYDRAKDVSTGVIVEHYYQGRDHRVLVVNHKVIAVAERIPAHVIGNGQDSIEALVEAENRDPRRGEGHDNLLTLIALDRAADELLARQGYQRDSVLAAGEICYLKATANLSTGGVAVDRTDEIHPETLWIAERASRIIGLDVAGIDIVTTDISQPLKAVNGVIVEVNAAPGLRMHVAPSQGVPRNVAAPILDMLFPPGSPQRIPIVAITGTNGKTTTTRLTAHILGQTYDTVGFTTTDGIYIDGNLIEKGDTTGPQSAQVILQDPTVDVAVLETARGGLLRSGLAFQHCDVGVVLNVAADHLGLGDIDTVEQLAQLKGVVAEAIHPSGYAVLNADDELVAAMAYKVDANVAYFSMDPDNPRVRVHTERGGIAAVYEQGYLSILKGDWLMRIEQASRVPLTMGGKAPFMIANALAASLAAFVRGVAIDDIRSALRSFRASTQQTPGRMNLFNLGKYHALVDYAHNPASYAALGSFVANWEGPCIGVVGAPGDRRNEDFLELGVLCGKIFDQVFIKEDDDRRGRAPGEVAELILAGLEQGAALANPTEPAVRPHVVELNETQAINLALDQAPEGSLVVILPEIVSRAIELISARNPLPEGELVEAGLSPRQAAKAVPSGAAATVSGAAATPAKSNKRRAKAAGSKKAKAAATQPQPQEHLNGAAKVHLT
ncbi:MAG: cyanophycin synthetase [Synechococcales cyanobacterium RM1_1_8]|nr:cyanophycin synthetase [Synechococcales cyanobacterium RM1_1_8]